MTSPITGVQGTACVFLRNNNDLMASYDRLLLYKSYNGASGAYSEVTAAAAAAATITGTKKELFSLSGLEFKFWADGVEYSVTFGAEDTAAVVGAKILADTGIQANDDGSGRVQIVSPTTGLSSTLEVQESTEAGVVLGFAADDYDIGEAARIALVTDQLIYSWVDYNCADSYFYKYRLYSTATLTYSDFSIPFIARPYDSVPVANLIYGTLQLMDSEGKPLEGKLVTVQYRRLGAVGAKVINGPMYSYYTDAAGAVDVPLVKESEIRVAVEGTRMVRDVQVPSTGSSFSLFDPAVQEFDALGIASYNAPDLTRGSF